MSLFFEAFVFLYLVVYLNKYAEGGNIWVFRVRRNSHPHTNTPINTCSQAPFVPRERLSPYSEMVTLPLSCRVVGSPTIPLSRFRLRFLWLIAKLQRVPKMKADLALLSLPGSIKAIAFKVHSIWPVSFSLSPELSGSRKCTNHFA